MKRAAFPLVIALLLGVAASGARAGAGLSLERSGLGLKPPSVAGSRAAGGPAFESAARSLAARSLLWAEPVPFGGVRETARLGYAAREKFGGISWPLSESLAASIEFAALDPAPLSPRRYSLAGQVHAPFPSGGGLRLGLAYRFYDPELRPRSHALIDAAPGNGYSLAPERARGLGLAPSYQLQLYYQYNPATTFGLVLGRELETFASGFDPSVTTPRQFSFTGQHWLTPSWALTYDVLSDDPGSFRLQGLRFGVRYRF